MYKLFNMMLLLTLISSEAFAENILYNWASGKEMATPCSGKSNFLQCSAFEIGFELGKIDKVNSKTSEYDRYQSKYSAGNEDSFIFGYEMGWSGYYTLRKLNNGSIILILNPKAKTCETKIKGLLQQEIISLNFMNKDRYDLETSSITGLVSTFKDGERSFRCDFTNSGVLSKAEINLIELPDATLPQDKIIMDKLKKIHDRHQ